MKNILNKKIDVYNILLKYGADKYIIDSTGHNAEFYVKNKI